MGCAARQIHDAGNHQPDELMIRSSACQPWRAIIRAHAGERGDPAATYTTRWDMILCKAERISERGRRPLCMPVAVALGENSRCACNLSWEFMEAVHTVNFGAFGGGRNRYRTARDDGAAAQDCAFAPAILSKDGY